MLHIKIINLDSKPERYVKTKAAAKRLLPGVDIQRFSGIVPTAVDAQRLGVDPAALWGGLGALGCYMSHKALYQECVERVLPAMLILEDDAQDYSFGTGVFASALAELPLGWDMLYLTIHPRNRREAYQSVSAHLARPTHGTTTSAYIISLQGAHKVLAHMASTPIGEIDAVLEKALPLLDAYVCVPFATSQRNGDVSTVEGRFSSFNCGAPYYISPVPTGRVFVNLTYTHTWEGQLLILAQVLAWQKVYTPGALLPVCILNESTPASYPFPKVYEGVPTVFDPPLTVCDSMFVRSVLNMICGGSALPAEVSGQAVAWEGPHDTLPWLIGDGAVAIPIKAGHCTFAALWLASKTSSLAYKADDELEPLLAAISASR